ncbi:MAG: hypothetical protein CL947_00195 [Epsilonproteobacteria bacterium]|nr:hypothetical protein [Campylobacterota bacterium]|tara:strand:- start:661 stop:1146 length:486 start_codon:yes stop_codon:yes gene_type:complete
MKKLLIVYIIFAAYICQASTLEDEYKFTPKAFGAFVGRIALLCQHQSMKVNDELTSIEQDRLQMFSELPFWHDELCNEDNAAKKYDLDEWTGPFCFSVSRNSTSVEMFLLTKCSERREMSLGEEKGQGLEGDMRKVVQHLYAKNKKQTKLSTNNIETVDKE